MRHIDPRELTHERLGIHAFDDALSQFDTQRRLEVLVDEFLPDPVVKGKQVLDVGTGLGFFAERLQRRGAHVTAIDIGEKLLTEVQARVGCKCERVDALAIAEHFGPARFDVVISSECIEHTPEPMEALSQMAIVLRPGGYLSVSTPSLLWYPAVRLATMLGLRPFDGLENFSTFGRVRQVMNREHIDVMREKGLHLFPFQFNLPRVSRWCDEHLQWVRELMINICV